MYSFILHHLLLLQSGNIEINPGPMKSSRLNFCHWNLISMVKLKSLIVAHDFVKVPLFKIFIKVNNIDIICLSETFLFVCQKHFTISLRGESHIDFRMQCIIMAL